MLDHFSIPAEKRLDLNRQILYCSDYDVSSMFICLAIVFLTLIFHHLKNHVGRHIMAIFQDDNVKIHQAQIVKEWLGGSMNNNFHM